jgi:hypothetical protein
MPAKMTFTEFIDVVIKVGTLKITKIRQIKNKPEYEPVTDFYRPLRQYLIEYHKNELYDEEKRISSQLTTDRKKFSHYDRLLNGYWKYLGKKRPKWFDPPKSKIDINGVEIIINPELGLIFGKEKYVIKLYLKTEEISKQKIDIALGMMEYNLKALLKEDQILAILDVRNSKLYKKTIDIPDLAAAVEAECAYIASIWEKI